ncbi:MAG: hypothetical protein FWD89_00560, partial [Firmicutes bacterium]|nr:hypothetical protein [Bacillota bacterium]
MLAFAGNISNSLGSVMGSFSGLIDSLSFIGRILSWALGKVMEVVFNFIMAIVDLIIMVVIMIYVYPAVVPALYSIFMLCYVLFIMPFFLIIDFLEMFFRRLAGLHGAIELGSGYAGVGVESTTRTNPEAGVDLVLLFIQSPMVWNVFLSLGLVAVALLGISTLIAILKSEWNFEKEGNAKGPIFGKAIKALLLFFAVPASAFFGVMFANMILRVIDQATRQDGNVSISGMLFYTAAQRGNRLMTNENFAFIWHHSRLASLG